MNLRSYRGFLAAVTLFAAASLPAYGALVTISDPNSDFTVTYDDSHTGPFGQPYLSNNTIFFLPDDFSATSTNGEGVAFNTDTIQLQLNAVDPDVQLDVFSLQESGDYILSGPNSSVSVSGELRISDALTPNDEFISQLQTGPLNINDGSLQQWVGNANIDGSDGWGGASSVLLTLQNNLFASTSDPNSLAFVQKKRAGIEIVVSVVPLPGAVWLFGAALVPLLAARRR